MAIQDYLTLSHLRKVVAAITQRIVGVENSVGSVENDVNEINGAIEELRNDKEVFVIDVSYDSSGDLTSSATYEEILNAYTNGKICVLYRDGDGSNRHPFCTYYSSAFIFGGGADNEAYIIRSDNSINTFENKLCFIKTGSSNNWALDAEDYNFDFLNSVFNHVDIYAYNSSTTASFDYNIYKDAIKVLRGSYTYIFGTDPITGNTVRFSQADSSTNEWTRTTKPGSYSLSLSSNVLTLTGSDGSTSSITLPVYNGSVSGGGSS